MGEDTGEPLRLRLDDDFREATSFHPWFAVQGTSAARLAVALTTSTKWLSEPDKLALVAAGDDEAIASAIVEGRPQREPGNADSKSLGKEERLLDLCAGIGTVAAVAARLGFETLSVESSIVPHLIDRVLHDFAISMAKQSSPRQNTEIEWRGYAAEVDDFATAVWRGAKDRLKELFEEDVDIRLWARIVPCPSCATQIPVLSNARLSRDTALNISPDPDLGRKSAFPRFGLLQTEFPDRKGTFARGICTCPVCHFQFPFHGYDLLPLRSVPVALRMRDSATLVEIDSPDIYVMQAEAAAHQSLAASSRNLGNRIVLGDQQSVFHDARGEPISVRSALLPRQRAYFAALAEAMDRQSALLAKRTALSADHRLAIRAAVALLISGQIDYVNMYAHWLVDKPHPSTSASHLRLGGLFTEAGGYSLERLWQSRLRHLLNLLQESSSAARTVRTIQADAGDAPIDDSSVSAVVWHPPDIDHEIAGEPFQAILAAMIPDIVGELKIPPRLPPPERVERHERELVRQACEARRVVNPNGAIGVFWLAPRPDERQRFLDTILPAGLQLLRAVRLDTIRTLRVVASPAPETYLLVLRPVPPAASAVVPDAEKVLDLATTGALSLYDGLAELLESVWGPADLDRVIPGEFQGAPRQRLTAFLASHPEPEQLLRELGRVTLLREVVSRGADGDELLAMDARGLAQRLLAQLGFAVPRPVRFAIRAALRECEIARSRLELADSEEAVRGSFVSCCTLIERILWYSVLAWSHLARGDQWSSPYGEILDSPKHPYRGPYKLSFGEHELLFVTLPAVFSDSADAFEKDYFGNIAWVMKKAKIHEKLSAVVTLRNSDQHPKLISSLTVPQLRQRCSSAVADACTALERLDSQQILPLTVRPEEERRDRYGRRILRLLDPDGVAIEAYVASETDLTEPLIYFASDTSRRDVDPRFLRASVVEEFLGSSATAT